MDNVGIPSSGVVVQFSHPGWTPEGVDGQALPGANPGDLQNFHMVKGSGVMIDGDSGFDKNFIKTDAQNAAGEHFTDANYRRVRDRTMTWVTPAGFNRWIQKFIEFVANQRVPATLRETFAARQLQRDQLRHRRSGNDLRKRRHGDGHLRPQGRRADRHFQQGVTAGQLRPGTELETET